MVASGFALERLAEARRTLEGGEPGGRLARPAGPSPARCGNRSGRA
jgi:hypothetical protein